MKPVAALLLMLVVVCGCARSGPQADGRACAEAMDEAAFPGRTVEDWVTYGDHLVRAVVRPVDAHGRIELVATGALWSRPDASPVPATVPGVGQASGAEGVDLEEGHAYLTLIARWQLPGQAPEWVSIDVLPFDNGIVGEGADQCWPAGSRPGREQIWGLDEKGVRQVLATTPPDPLAAPYADLEPVERYQRVAADR